MQDVFGVITPLLIEPGFAQGWCVSTYPVTADANSNTGSRHERLAAGAARFLTLGNHPISLEIPHTDTVGVNAFTTLQQDLSYDKHNCIAR